MCISAQDAYASEEEATLLVASYFFARLGIKAEAFSLPYCNSDSKIIQVILRFNLIVFHSTLAKKYAALNKEKRD